MFWVVGWDDLYVKGNGQWKVDISQGNIQFRWNPINANGKRT